MNAPSSLNFPIGETGASKASGRMGENPRFPGGRAVATQISQSVVGNPTKKRSLRATRAVVNLSIVLLFFQLLLGMWANLFASFPSPVQSVNPIDQIFTGGPALLVLHVIVGLILGILSIVGIIGAAYTKNARLIALAACALLSVLAAGESGIEFVLGGYQEDVYSYTMTVGYAALLATYIATSKKMGELGTTPHGGNKEPPRLVE
jgi:hypothetical protein